MSFLMAAVMVAVSIPMTAGAVETEENTEIVVEDQETPANSGEEKSSDAEGAGTPESKETSENIEAPGDGTAETKETSEPESTTEETPEKNTAENENSSAAGTVKEEEKTADNKEEAPSTKEQGAEEAADDKVVTLGENLTEEQRASMYAYFGTSADEVRTIIVTHADEVKYMEGIATDEQIGPTTNSCAYVEPTDSGGIKVKTANLNFVTSAMIASTLTTAGMENCNVIAACPFEVSGTGALTGIMMAYEIASGTQLDEGQKEAAVEELITTGNLADTLGQEKAAEVMNSVKTEIIDQGLTDGEEIGAAVDEIAVDNGVTLTEEQRDQIVSLMEKISQYDYDIKALQDTLDNLSGKVSGLENVWQSIKSFFVGSDDGILSETNDEALGEDVITDSTENEDGYKDGLLTRIVNFFKN